MKKTFFILPALTLVFLVAISFTKRSVHTVPAQPGFAVVELYTSEGCSSCPPADDAVAAITKEYPDNVFVLGFHVDYWNQLGWRDVFSKTAYTNRQRKYSEALKLNSIYTPQVIVNGTTEFVGSKENILRTTIKNELERKPSATINLTVAIKENKKIEVNYKISGTGNQTLNIALVQLHAVSAVKRGENEGRQLSHVNVVRDFKTTSTPAGTVSLTIPDNLQTSACKVIAFLQNKPGDVVTGAAAASLGGQ
jgi:hypothetical protein